MVCTIGTTLGIPRDVYLYPWDATVSDGMPWDPGGIHGNPRDPTGESKYPVEHRVSPWDVERVPVGCTTAPHGTLWYTVGFHKDFIM